ncbi:MAG: stage II sporulation protein P [Lachnospiraceae bacterium]|nr:stage II sporulation protein P [Lachnospiraceae bacterium]
MSIRKGHSGIGKKGAAMVLAAALGTFFLQDGPSRMTILAAGPPLLSFLSGETAESLGRNLLKQASGIQTFASFMEQQEEEPIQKDGDPAYRVAVAEAESDGEAFHPAAAQTGAAEGGSGTGEVEEQTGETGQAAEGSNGQETAQTDSQENSQAVSGTPAMAATEIKGTVYTAEQLADFEFVKKTFFYVHKSTTVYPEQLDASVLLGKDMTLPESAEPQILLFHTHGSEAFSDSEEGNPDMTVVGLGNYLAQLLSEQYGIQVIHNTEVFPYSDSYSMALDMIKRTLAEYPSIQVTIDLHRDSGGHDVVDINGKPTAPIMLFNGMCQTPDGPLEDVENPYLLDNLAFNFQMKLAGEAYYPGLMLRTFLKAYRYNQHVLPRATLVEVGTENNTYEEAKNAMEPLADILYKVLRGK